MAEQVMNDHTPLRLADEGPYDLFARGVQAIDSEPEQDIQYQRPTRDQQISAAVQRLDRQIEDAQWVHAYLRVGGGSQTSLGTYNAAHGPAGLAELLRQVADRLDP